MSGYPWEFDYKAWQDESIKLSNRLISVSDITIRKDLQKMYLAVYDLAVDITREEVECRRKRRQSYKHQEMLKKFAEMKQNLIEHITWALLM